MFCGSEGKAGPSKELRTCCICFSSSLRSMCVRANVPLCISARCWCFCAFEASGFVHACCAFVHVCICVCVWIMQERRLVLCCRHILRGIVSLRPPHPHLKIPFTAFSTGLFWQFKTEKGLLTFFNATAHADHTQYTQPPHITDAL